MREKKCKCGCKMSLIYDEDDYCFWCEDCGNLFMMNEGTRTWWKPNNRREQSREASVTIPQQGSDASPKLPTDKVNPPLQSSGKRGKRWFAK